MTYLQGRLFAATPAEAVDKLHAWLQQQGYEAAGAPKLWACAMQPIAGLIWVEYVVEVVMPDA